MTLQYYMYEVRQLLPDTKESLDDREIIRLINLQRALWIKNEINKNRPPYDNLVQTIHIELSLQDQSTYPGITTTSRILRSTVHIPKPIITATRDTILNVRNPLILAEPFNYITRDDAVYCGNGKLNTKDVFFWVYDSHLWIKLNKANPKLSLLRDVAIEGIWEDPVLVDRDYIQKVTDNEYEEYDMEYPMNDVMWTYIKGYIGQNASQVIQQHEQEDTRKDT